MKEIHTESGKPNNLEMLSFGGAQFAINLFMAFSSYYLLGFLTDVSLIHPGATAALMIFMRLLGSINDQFIGVFMNRTIFKDGKYRPYFKWLALPFAVGLTMLGISFDSTATIKILYTCLTLAICQVCWSSLNLTAWSLFPYMTRNDSERTKFVSFSNACSIMAYLAVGTFIMPLTDIFGNGDKRTGFFLTLALFAVLSVPLNFNAYFRLKERHYGGRCEKTTIKEMFLAIAQNRQIMLFMAGYCLYCIGDSFKNETTYFYMINNMQRPDMLPVIITVSLLTNLAMQPLIPRLLAFASKETLIVVGLFASSFSSLLMLAARDNIAMLIVCALFYGIFSAIVANLVFGVLASFSDQIHEQKNINMSEILAATMSLSAKIGAAIVGGVAPLVLAVTRYNPGAALQSAGTLMGIKMLFIVCTSIATAFSGVVMLLFRSGKIAGTTA